MLPTYILNTEALRMFGFSNKSKERLATCEDDLQRVMNLAITYSKYDFGITEGIRSISKQQENVDKLVSQTMASRHLANKFGKSEAVDIVIYVNNKVTWEAKHYRKVASAVFKAAFELGIPIEWGGHWESLFDGPHFQLSNKA